MRVIKRFVMVVLIAAALCLNGLSGSAAFAQKGNDKRPPKEPTKIKEPPKPPPKNDNQGNSNRGRGKP